MVTWTERYYARGRCSSCGTILWCSTDTDSVGCSVTCGVSVLNGDSTSQGNVVPIDDVEHEAAVRNERRIPVDDVVDLVKEGGG